MRSRTATWYETKVKYDRMMDNGGLKTASEQYVVDAVSFTEAETQILKEMKTYVSGEFKITNIVESSYKEIFFSDKGSDDKWYKVKLQFLTIDENSEKERRQTIYYLIQAATLPLAVKYLEAEMAETVTDYTIMSIAETAIMDVFEHKAETQDAE